MDNLAEQGKAPRKGKTKPFLIGKELKKKTYAMPRSSGQADHPQNQNQKPRIAYAERRVKPLARLLRVCYGPAGDSAPRLRLKAFWYGRKEPFGPATARNPKPTPPFPS